MNREQGRPQSGFKLSLTFSSCCCDSHFSFCSADGPESKARLSSRLLIRLAVSIAFSCLKFCYAHTGLRSQSAESGPLELAATTTACYYRKVIIIIIELEPGNKAPLIAVWP